MFNYTVRIHSGETINVVADNMNEVLQHILQTLGVSAFVNCVFIGVERLF